jgi:hypothetical protein
MALLTKSCVEIVGLACVAPVACGVVGDCAKAGVLNRAHVVASAMLSFMAYSYVIA